MADASNVAARSPDSTALRRIETRLQLSVAVGALLLAGGVAALLAPTPASAKALGAVVVACGAALVCFASFHLRLIARAGEALRCAPRPMQLEREPKLGARYGWSTRLFAAGSGEHPIATFGFSQCCVPTLLATHGRLPALVYGGPVSRGVVVVSCDAGVLVGRLS
jgi:hypothetical protein